MPTPVWGGRHVTPLSTAHAEYADHPDCPTCMHALKGQQNGIAQCRRETVHARQTTNVTCPWR
eukprot:282176-Prymnesium_polylepis.1